MSSHKNIASLSSIPSLQMDEQELVSVLTSSLYPGADIASVKLVIGYCRAGSLDPMQKPVHIVPMWDRNLGRMRDVIMPGVGLYRTQAARSGECAGISEPEFGNDVTETIDGVSITYPAWCRVTVMRRLKDGTIAEFTAVERWKENYAVKGGKEKSIAPNAMWQKRPYGQLAKCAEAQALRKAFPEHVSAAPTAEEMEGKEIDMGQAERITDVKPKEPEVPPYPPELFDKNFPAWESAIMSGANIATRIIAMVSTKGVLTAEMVDKIHAVQANKDAQQEEEAVR